jgi:anti-sigma factor RsiW
MPETNESQCYFVQLQIDSFLDGELAAAQRDAFLAHVQQCQQCGNEYRYAQTVQDEVLGLPLLDCAELALEPIHRLAEGSQVDPGSPASAWWGRLGDLVHGTPLLLRYAVPALALAVLALLLLPVVSSPQQETTLMAGQSARTEPAYKPEDVVQALEELNVAIEYLNQLTERTEVMIGERFLIAPLQDSLNASFERAGKRNSKPLNDGPI